MRALEGKAALVTGGTRGIGFAIASALASRGVRLYLCGRDEGSLSKAVAGLRNQHGGQVEGSSCDVRDFASVQSVFSEVARCFGSLDILVNNAGVGSHRYVEQMTVEEWNATIETNLSGVFHCCHAAIPLMKGSPGAWIVNIGSLAGKNTFVGGAAYCASKFGLLGFTEALMEELRYEHIRVSCIMPGSVNTGFGLGSRQDSSQSWKLTPEDVAEAVLYLLETDPRALPSRIELRPSEPMK